MNDKQERVRRSSHIDYKKIYTIILKHKRLYFIVLPVVLILAALYSLSLPNYYICTVKLSPELSASRSSSLSSLASSLGIDVGTALNNTSDALRPAIYPELMASVDFRAELLKVRVKPKGSETESSYYDYLRYGQKRGWLSSAMSSLFGQSSKVDTAKLDPHRMTKRQSSISKAVGRKITCSASRIMTRKSVQPSQTLP